MRDRAKDRIIANAIAYIGIWIGLLLLYFGFWLGVYKIGKYLFHLMKGI